MRAVSNKTRIETKAVWRDPIGRLSMRAVSNKTRIETSVSLVPFLASVSMRAVSNKTRIETQILYGHRLTAHKKYESSFQ